MKRFMAILLFLVFIPSLCLAENWDEFINSHDETELLELYQILTKLLVQKGSLVYITPTGTKYHCRQDCRNMEHAIPVPTQIAVDCGYDACKVCHKKK